MLRGLSEVFIQKFRKPGMNAIFLTTADAFGKLVLFLAFVFFARGFGVLAYGHFSFAFSLGAILVIVADPGVNQFIIREIAAQRNETIAFLAKLFLLKIFLLLPFSLATLLYCAFASVKGQPLLLVLLMTLYFWVDSLHQFIRNIIRAKERMEVDLISRVIERSLLFVLIGLTVLWGKSSLLSAACFPAVALLSMMRDLWVIKPFSLLPRLTLPDIRLGTIFRRALPFVFSHIVFTLYFRVDTLMLQVMKGFESVALYNAAYRLFEGTQIIPVAIAGSLYPMFARLRARKDPRLPGIIKKVALIIGALAIALTLVLWSFSEMITRAVYGASYALSERTLAILSLGILFNFLYMVFGYVLTTFDKQGLLVLYGVIVLVTNIGLNLILIPTYGPVGAAVSTVLCEATLACIVLGMVRKLVREYRRGTQKHDTRVLFKATG